MYNKTEWESELGTGLNRFHDLISGQTLELTRQPTSVTRAGTVFSVDAMNNIEDGIEALDLQNLSITITGNHTIGAYGTILVNTGTATITVTSLDLGIRKLIRKISATAGTITITLPTGHTFSGGGQSITLTNQYEEVTIERVSSNVWIQNKPAFADVSRFGAIADGVTDNTALFNSLLASYNSLFIPPTANGFAIAGVVIPDNKSIFGIGKASKIVPFNGANSALITLGNNNNISNLGFYSSEGKDSGKGNQVALFINNKFNNIVEGCYGEGLGGTLCRVINAVGVHQGNTITNCISANCNIGIDIAERGEYVKVTACSMYVNNVGLFVVGGNICVNGCTISDNTTGVYVGAGSNDAHGVINGCTINHNVNAIVVLNTISEAFLFSNCMIYFGNINLTGCTGITFRGCDLSSVVINEDGCRRCYFKNCHEVGANVVINPNITNDSEVFYLDMEWDSSVPTTDKKRMNGGYLELKQTVRTEYGIGLNDITWQNIVFNSIPANLSYTVQEFYDFDLATPFIHTGTKSVLTGFNVKMRSQLLVGNPAGTAWNSKDVTIRIIDSTGVCIGVFTPDRVDSNPSATHTVQYHFDGIVVRKEFKIVIENRTAGNMRIYEDQANVVVKNYLIVEGI